MIPISYKIQVTVGEFKIMMTLDEVKELRNKLNELCGESNKNHFIQFGQGIRNHVVTDSLARGITQWPNDPDITMRQGE